jgi:hypothetical protein
MTRLRDIARAIRLAFDAGMAAYHMARYRQKRRANLINHPDPF